ncbi:MAG: bifunctional (p)ppGpp synthetase/guanosine-3',5'-bis(diphosphate) 3'-pyrophosphohydrolase [Clostridia bacterium]|nr:bifunctional (p)ppGpp synthetase/guanosine-3',5'-bis(diphosphate) 3'-pyrophosphohydrolase [Deltaproteobacteria bacterium]
MIAERTSGDGFSKKITRRFEDIIEAVQEYHPSPDMGLIQRAYMYSAKVHAGQVRKSGEPYLIHPLEVAWLLTQLRLDEASVATGLLHDTVEDTLATLDDIKNMFGLETATLVDGVTKLSQIRFDNDQHKQAENFRKMLVAMAKDIRVVLVKLADRLHNMRTLEHMSPPKQMRIAQETLDIYAPLANRLGINWIKSELEDLSFRYLQPLDFKQIDDRITELNARREDYVVDIIKVLRDELAKRGIIADVQGRPKHLYSIYKKMTARHLEFDQVHDIIAFRVLTESVGRCYEVLGHVHSLWHPIPGRFKDYIAMPKPNNYQSLHTSVIGPGGERIEIQIRTREMHRVAEEGIAAHWEYKEGRIGDKSKQQFAWLRQLLEWQRDLQDPTEFLDTVKYDLFTDEVFVFTPKGEVISLKKGASPVDFAFAIHSEVGLHCSGAKVNGRMVPLRTELKSGDMVEIMTNPSQRPSKDWLGIARTGKAKSRIRAYIRANERARSKELGREMLERDLKRVGMSLQKLTKEGRLQQIAEESRHGTLDGLLISIGYGRTTVHSIVEKLAPDAVKKLDEPQSLITSLFKRAMPSRKRRSTGGVVVQGIDDMLVRFGKCCAPLPGDPITGFVSRGKGITVHLATCTRAADLDPARRIDVSWDEKGSYARPVNLRVMTGDRPGILATISQCFTNNGVNIAQANCKVTAKDRAINTFEVMIKDTDQLHKVVNQIKSLKGVIGVERI